MPLDKLIIVSNGIFFSLINYGIQLYGGVSGLVEYRQDSGRYKAMTREDSRTIQVITNIVLRAITNLDKETPVKVLLEKSGFLSFHQMCAFSTICTAKKILLSGQPKYLYDSLTLALPDTRRLAERSCLSYRLSLARESFLYKAVRLYSKLPVELRSSENVSDFKRKAKIWVRDNVSIYM